MKLLLTSGGITNISIADAFIDLAGKDAKDIKVAFIPTAGLILANNKDWLIDDMYNIKKLGCYVDIVDLAQLKKDEWLPRVELCDVIFVGGGNGFYLSYCMQKSGFMDELPRLLETRVYCGISAGSMIAGQSFVMTSAALDKPEAFIDEDYDDLGPVGRSDGKALQLVNLVFRSHLNSPKFPKLRKDFIAERAQKIPEPVYALDDDSALKIFDDKIAVISEGEWLVFNEEKA